MAREFTLVIGSDSGGLPAELLTESLAASIGMLCAVAADLGPDGDGVRFDVVASAMNSPLRLTLAVRPAGRRTVALGERAVGEAAAGLRQVAGCGRLPDHFDEDALLFARRLVTAPNRHAARLRVYGPDGDEFEPPKQSGKNITAAIAEARGRGRHEFGSVEGRVQQLTIRGGETFAIWDVRNGKRVVCEATPDLMREAAALLLTRSRAAVAGRLTVSGNRVRRVAVQAIRRLRETAELPQFDTLGLVDITGGMASEDFVREVRDGD